MYSFVKIFLRLLFLVFVAIATYLAFVIGVGVVSDYQPEEITELTFPKKNNSIISDSVFTFISWNIGYCGLGRDMDFFYDGGKMVRPKKEVVKKYTTGVLDFLKSADSLDFMLLQEVDVNSSRTSKQNEVQIIGQELNQYTATFGYNYKVKFVPIPFFNPLGKVEMGQMNLSKASPVSSQRYSYYSAYSWPMRLFMLDRCFIVSRFQLTNGKQLVVLNTHNSAYDAGGKLREKEMPVIRDVMINEFEKGNYVVAGGDWNQNPPDYSIENISGNFQASNVEKIDFSIFPKGWKIVYDKNSGTNRSLDFPLSIEKTKVTLIDYYIVSPNLKVEAIQTLTQNFQFSDHEPVFLRIKLN